MSFPDAVKICFNKYVGFSGRARRSEFWWWVLFTFLLGIVASIIDSILGTRSSSGSGLVSSLVNLAVLLPSLAVGARRLHDTGRSGWWQLLWIAIVIGWIFLIIWLCQDSHGDNKYGPSPKGASGGPGYAQPTYGDQGYGQPPQAPPPSGPDYGQPPAPPASPQNPYGT
jgi:uncharacterized membrane protein YhaH (DUF805 family)